MALVILLAPVGASAQDGVRPVAFRAIAIGNSAYKRKEDILHKATADARAFGAALTTHGRVPSENVTIISDAPLQVMITELAGFERSLKEGDIAIVFFSGHGFQYREESYVVPVDASNTSEAGLTLANIPISYVMDLFKRARVGLGIIVLDACRDYPSFLADSGHAKSQNPRGLGRPQTPGAGVFIGYAASVGMRAWEGPAHMMNSVYTAVLLDEIPVEGQDLFRIFNRVSRKVEQLSSGAQQPWLASGGAGLLIFNPTPEQLREEEQTWELAKSLGPSEVFAFLNEYPASRFAPAARNYLRQNAAQLARAANLSLGLRTEGNSKTLTMVGMAGSRTTGSSANPGSASTPVTLGGTLGAIAASPSHEMSSFTANRSHLGSAVPAVPVDRGLSVKAVVQDPVLPLFTTSQSNSAVQGTLQQGAVVELRQVDLKQNRALVVSEDGTAGWIPGVRLEPAKPTGPSATFSRMLGDAGEKLTSTQALRDQIVAAAKAGSTAVSAGYYRVKSSVVSSGSVAADRWEAFRNALQLKQQLVLSGVPAEQVAIEIDTSQTTKESKLDVAVINR